MIIEKTNTIKSYSLISILPFSIITSLDAFSVGLALSYKKINTILFSIRIGIITLVLSLVGCMIGRYIKTIKQIEVNKMGGIILILYALKILLDR